MLDVSRLLASCVCALLATSAAACASDHGDSSKDGDSQDELESDRDDDDVAAGDEDDDDDAPTKKPSSSSSSGGTSSSSAEAQCEDTCSEQGYATSEVKGGKCSCDTFADTACIEGVVLVCACLEADGEEGCSDEDMYNMYTNCFQDNGGARAPLTCAGGYYDAKSCSGAYSCFN